MKHVQIFTYYWLPLIAYCILIFVQSAFPTSESIPPLPFMDKFLHLTGYALLGILFLRAFKTLPLKNNVRLLLFLSMLSSTLYGISDEFHQSFVSTRHSDMIDIFADGIGSIFGVLGYHMVRK